jgi:hypothetical protein
LILSNSPDRFARLADVGVLVVSESQAICVLAGQPNSYRAVVAGVAGSDGRESGYRLVQFLRSQLQVRCPIYLFSPMPTPSSRAYALQCGATRVLTDDQDLIGDLLHLLQRADTGDH